MARLNGTENIDYIYGTTRADIAYLGSGDDFIFTMGGADVVYDNVSPEPEWVNPWLPEQPELTAGNDTVWLGNGRDSYFFESGKDWVHGGKGFDTIYVHKDMEVVQEFNNRLILQNEDGDRLVIRDIESIQYY